MAPETSTYSVDSIVVGRSARMRAVFDFVRVIADSDSSVLVTGETGTGKEMIANLIHSSSSRRHKPFVPVSCAILSETLIESELFGHERGAFTGAIKDRPGRFELAQGGTIFLDDIDDVPLAMQVKLLRVLQNHTIERLGGTRTIPVDVRVITGSKKDLRALVAEGKFREDLFYRLNVIPIVLPPLRERASDIPALVQRFLDKANGTHGTGVAEIDPAALDLLVRHPWPGNIRQLESVVERAVLLCEGTAVQPVDLPLEIRLQTAPAARPYGFEIPAEGIDIEELERQLIVQAMERSGWVIARAARLLGLTYRTLQYRLEKFGIRKPA